MRGDRKIHQNQKNLDKNDITMEEWKRWGDPKIPFFLFRISVFVTLG